MPAFYSGRNVQNLLLIMVAIVVVLALVWILRDPLRSAMATAAYVRTRRVLRPGVALLDVPSAIDQRDESAQYIVSKITANRLPPVADR